MANEAQATRVDEEKWSRRRVAVMVAVHIAVGLHIAHWKMTGRSVAPLELNEVVYTFAIGIITAGFLLLVTATVATAIFGRYFCSWSCHILALQDIARWLLGKLGIKPRPFRSRILRWVPLVAAGYMFAAPLIARVIHEGRLPTFHFRSDSEGFASLVTSDFWRNLPGGWVILTTFVLCGFVMVYALGARAFCTNVCPYGALFGLADRIAPGRLVSKGDCSGCARCTAVCSSHIKVHEELARFGTIVDSACLRDLDCMAACPKQDIVFRFTTPPLFRAADARRGLQRKFDFVGLEELAIFGFAVAVFFSVRGLYDTVPFLLAIALSVLCASIGVIVLRVLRRRDARFQKLVLVREGKLQASGAGFLAFGGALALLWGHSAWMRWHEFASERVLATLERMAAPDPRTLEEARAHVELVQRFGLIDSRPAKLRRARVAELSGDLAAAERVLVELAAGKPNDRFVVLPLARVWVRQGRADEAREWLEKALLAVPEVQHDRRDALDYLAEVHLRLGELAVGVEDLERARTHFASALELAPQWALAHYQLGVVYAAGGDMLRAKGSFARAVELSPSDADARNNLGFLLLNDGLTTDAELQLRAAVSLAPKHAAAHFNLGRALLELGRERDARTHFETARGLDPRYGEALDEMLAQPRR
ncbi:MAG: tetratricopeptide repeat protein [Planctomycetes bacterium]|nr:tetratricopeptide repeat protein [Planctomycetota bacterium]